MRSLVADILHSLSRNSLVASSPNSSSCGPITTRTGASTAAAGRSIRRSAAPLAARRRQFVAGLQRPRIWTAEAGACIDGEAAEHRLTRNPALDREVAEGTAARKAKRQGLAVGQRHRRTDCNGAAGDVGVARGARERDADRAFARGKRRAERADLDRRREQRISGQDIGRRKREPRPSRHLASGHSAGHRGGRRPAPSSRVRWMR